MCIQNFSCSVNNIIFHLNQENQRFPYSSTHKDVLHCEFEDVCSKIRKLFNCRLIPYSESLWKAEYYIFTHCFWIEFLNKTMWSSTIMKHSLCQYPNAHVTIINCDTYIPIKTRTNACFQNSIHCLIFIPHLIYGLRFFNDNTLYSHKLTSQ